MSDMRYFGTYADFRAASKKESEVLVGADNLVGDLFTVDFRVENGRTTAWIVNKFGVAIGRLDQSLTHRLDVLRARGWCLHALLSQVFCDNAPDPGTYWGRVALVCNEARYEPEIGVYLAKLGAELGKGIRPVVDLAPAGVDALLAAGGDWLSSDHLPLENPPKGTVLVKDSQSFLDKMVEQGRARNPGCYVVSWLFIIALVALVVFVVGKLVGWF
ncbi:MAG: hypothetical protein Q4E12_03910 [Coriobacteriia bacterium]|nr:hypothetical protein [Coriobacteriia bacterium]